MFLVAESSVETKKALPILFLMMFLVMVGFGIIIPVLPFLAEKVGGNSTETWFVNGRLFVNAIDICPNVGTDF